MTKRIKEFMKIHFLYFTLLVFESPYGPVLLQKWCFVASNKQMPHHHFQKIAQKPKWEHKQQIKVEKYKKDLKINGPSRPTKRPHRSWVWTDLRWQWVWLPAMAVGLAWPTWSWLWIWIEKVVAVDLNWKSCGRVSELMGLVGRVSELMGFFLFLFFLFFFFFFWWVSPAVTHGSGRPLPAVVTISDDFSTKPSLKNRL